MTLQKNFMVLFHNSYISSGWLLYCTTQCVNSDDPLLLTGDQFTLMSPCPDVAQIV